MIKTTNENECLGVAVMNASLYYRPYLNQKPAKNHKGRLGITRGQALLVTLALGLLFCLAGGMFSAEVKADETYFKVVTVREGDSIWEFASRYHEAAKMETEEMVDAIIEANQLENVLIYPGQNLKIPVMP